MNKTYTITFITNTIDIEESNVPCDGCNKCCHLSPLLTSEEFESGEYIYTFIKHDGINSPVVVIPRTKDGCVYLKNDKCSIYESRPLACRQFDCRKGHYLPLLDWAREKFGSNIE